MRSASTSCSLPWRQSAYDTREYGIFLRIEKGEWYGFVSFVQAFPQRSSHHPNLKLQSPQNNVNPGSLYHCWEVTLTAQAQGTLYVGQLSTVKLVVFPLCDWIFADCLLNIQCFPVTLRNRSEGPFSHLRVRFEPSAATAAKTAAANFLLDTFSFWDGAKRVDLARSDTRGHGWHFPSEATSYDLARARVMLRQLAELTSSALSMLI